MSEAPARPRLRHVLLPAEHGGWAFLGEPVLLGLMVAPSVAGAGFALAAAAGFLARTPLRLVAGDRRRGREYPRTRLAARAGVACAVIALAGLAVSVWRGGPGVLIAAALAAPAGGVAIALDLGRRSRELAAELAAVLALGATAAGIALGAGWPLDRALALWGVLVARGVPSVLVVRARLRLDRGEEAHAGTAIAASVAGALAGAAWAAAGLAPWAAAGALALLVARAAWVLSPVRARWSTPQLGVSEVIAGLVVVFATAAGLAAGR